MLRDATRLSERKRTPEGFLLAPAVLTLVGTAEYDAADAGVGKAGERVRVERTRDTLRDAETLASLAAAPIVLDHPAGGVNAENWRRHAVGQVVGTPYFEDDRVRAKLLITDAAAIKLVDNGVDELSVSYEVGLTPHLSGPNVPTYRSSGPLRAEHIAVVDRGRARAGRDAKIADALTGSSRRVTVPGDDVTGTDGGDDVTADQLNAALDAKLPALLRDALPSVLKQGDDKVDVGALVSKLTDAVKTAVVEPVAAVVKKLTDAEEARQTAAAQADAETKAAEFEREIRADEQAKTSVLLDAIPHVGVDKIGELRGKSSMEILAAALSGKVEAAVLQDALARKDESFLRGALAMLPKPAVTSIPVPPGSVPGGLTARPQDALSPSSTARDAYIKSLTGEGDGK